MKLGPVLTYKDVAEAKKLMGKRVVYSNCFKSINNFQDCLRIANDVGPLILNEVREGPGLYYPFRLPDCRPIQFIREVIDDEPHYEPYDFSNPEIRESLLGKRFLAKYAGIENKYEEYQVTGFIPPNRFSGEWLIGGIRAKDFMRSFVWSDYSVCGEKVKEKQ